MYMDKEQFKELKKISNTLKPMFNLGKEGLTDNFVKTIDEYLEAHNIVKIKVLIAGDKDDVGYFADEIAKETESIIIEKKGFTFTLFKE